MLSMFKDRPEHYHINVKAGLSKKQVKKINKINKRNLICELTHTKCKYVIISGEVISLLKVPALIIVDTTQLMKQWMEENR